MRRVPHKVVDIMKLFLFTPETASTSGEDMRGCFPHVGPCVRVNRTHHATSALAFEVEVTHTMRNVHTFKSAFSRRPPPFFPIRSKASHSLQPASLT